MTNRRGIGACLYAAFEPTQPNRAPMIRSKSMKQAMGRMSSEADELKQVALGHRPFRDTLRDLLERLK